DKVDLASHMLHLTPRDLPHQRVIAARLGFTPEPGRVSAGVDHFGNTVTHAFLDLPHDRFEVVVEARVAVAFPAPPAAEATPPWEEVAEAARAGGPEGWQAAEFAFGSPMAPPNVAA